MGNGNPCGTCSAGFIQFCEDTFGTSCCSACATELAILPFLEEYLDGSELSFYKKNIRTGKIMKIPTDIDYRIDRGVLNINESRNSASLLRLLSDPSIAIVCENGKNYCTGVNFTNKLIRLNYFKELSTKVDHISSLISTYSVINDEKNLNIITNLLDQKLKVKKNEYNYIIRDYFIDAYELKNKNALKIVKISTQISFLWGIINNLAIQYGVKRNIEFTLTFFDAIFNNLNGTSPILAEGLNEYFNKYQFEFVPHSYNEYLLFWNNIYDNDPRVIYQLIYSQSTSVFSIETMTLEQIFKYFNNELVEINFRDCICHKINVEQEYSTPFPPLPPPVPTEDVDGYNGAGPVNETVIMPVPQNMDKPHKIKSCSSCSCDNKNEIKYNEHDKLLEELRNIDDN